MRDLLKSEFVNDARSYQEYFKKRNMLSEIMQYETPMLSNVTTDEQEESLTVESYMWKTGDRLYKLAQTYYNDPSYWWIIAWYNLKPTEHHFQAGDVIDIPMPLQQIMLFLNYEH